MDEVSRGVDKVDGCKGRVDTVQQHIQQGN